jgi:hypothetical protein
VTEPQLLLFPAFRALPVYDERDERADTITTVAGAGGYCRIRECATVREVEACLADPRFVPLGALCGGADGSRVVVAYFGENG